MDHLRILVAQARMETMLAEARHDAEVRRLRQHVRGDGRGWLLKRGGRIVYRLGHVLVVLGQHLQQAGTMPQVALETGKTARS